MTFLRKIAGIRGALRDPERIDALDVLISTGVKGVADLIGVGLDENRDGRERAMAVWALGELQARAATVPLLRLLDQPDRKLSYHAAASLIGIGNQTIVPILCRFAVDSPHWPCRAGAVWILRELVDRTARPVLIQALLKDSNPTVRKEAAVSLVSYPGKRTYMALAEALSDPVPTVRDASVFAVGCLSSKSGVEVTQGGLRKLVRDRSVGRWGTIGSHARDTVRAVSEYLAERQRRHKTQVTSGGIRRQRATKPRN
jgi:HEAT repeat protein